MAEQKSDERLRINVRSNNDNKINSMFIVGTNTLPFCDMLHISL